MINIGRQIDHLVYATNDLEATVNDLEQHLGIRPIFGGFHQTQGTKNALVNLGNGCYLEILAIDEKNTTIAAPRWMGIDWIEKPQLTRWAIKSSDLEYDSLIMKSFNPKMGNIKGGQRQLTNGNLLTWQLTMPLTTPKVEVIPFSLNWGNVHPTMNLPQYCELLELKLAHPNPEFCQDILNKLGVNLKVEKSIIVEIKAMIRCLNGIIEL